MSSETACMRCYEIFENREEFENHDCVQKDFETAFKEVIEKLEDVTGFDLKEKTLLGMLI